jgi:hypothetical protein
MGNNYSGDLAEPPCLRHRELSLIDHVPLPKTDLTPIEKTHNPGILLALIFVTRQNGLRFCENEALFDRKLLEYLHEQGILFMPGKAGLRARVRARR